MKGKHNKIAHFQLRKGKEMLGVFQIKETNLLTMSHVGNTAAATSVL
jgi:hypothetical protein